MAKQLRHQLGDDADHPTHILTEPRFGYRMEQEGGQEQETESSDSSVWAEPRRRQDPLLARVTARATQIYCYLRVAWWQVVPFSSLTWKFYNS